MTHINITHNIALIDRVENYTLLQSEVEKAGLLDRAYGYYAVLIITSLIGFFLSLYYVITIKSIPILVIWDIALAFFTVQLSGIMHDAGHRAIFKTSKMNDVVGFICAVLIVMGYSSWKTKHYLHHAHTNEEDVDPDLGLPILSFTVEKYRARKGVQKILSRYQSYLYYPIGLLVNFSVRITSMMYFWKNLKKYSVEIILFTIGLIVMYIVPFLVFDFIKAITLVIVFNFFSGVYLLNIFAPNHKGMPVLKRGKKISFLEQQIMTSRNVKGSAIVDYIYMGVNYQIEHHLFPNCPRNKLKLIVPYVKNLAQDMNLDYTEVGIIESNRIILSELHKITQT